MQNLKSKQRIVSQEHLHIHSSPQKPFKRRQRRVWRKALQNTDGNAKEVRMSVKLAICLGKGLFELLLFELTEINQKGKLSKTFLSFLSSGKKHFKRACSIFAYDQRRALQELKQSKLLALIFFRIFAYHQLFLGFLKQLSSYLREEIT